MIRFIICVIAVVLYVVLSIPLLLITWLISLKRPDISDMIAMYYVKVGFIVVQPLAGVRSTIIGYDKIPRDNAVLFVGNHRSFFDIIVTGAGFFRPTGFVAKKELGIFPVFSHWMKFIHCKFLDRSDIKAGMQMIMDCITDIKNGVSIVIYPEGTRNSGEEGSLLPFHEGSLKIAEKTGCAIVPVAISNTQAIFEEHFPKIVSTHIVVEYCDPIYPKDLTKEERKQLGSYVRDIIADKLKEHKLKNLY